LLFRVQDYSGARRAEFVEGRSGVAEPNQFQDMLVDLLPRLRAYAIWLTRNRAAADDLIQEAAYRALRAKNQFTLGTNFTAWMFKIVLNEFITSKRRARRVTVPIDDVPEGYLLQLPDQEGAVFGGQVLRALDQLRPSQRQALELICAAGLSYEEAAETVNCSVGTIKSRLWRARRHMEELLQGASGLGTPPKSEAPDAEQAPEIEDPLSQG